MSGQEVELKRISTLLVVTGEANPGTESWRLPVFGGNRFGKAGGIFEALLGLFTG